MLENLISDIIDAGNEFLNGLIVNLLQAVFEPERTMDVSYMGMITFGGIDFNPLFTLFRNIGLGFIVLKLLKKGFDIYIGWVDGDKDNDVGHLMLNYLRATIMVLAFPEIYRFIVNVITTLLGETLNALTAGATPDFDMTGISLTGVAVGIQLNTFIMAILLLVLLVILLILYFRLLIMGLQLLMLRIAFPIACVGLVDSDKGIFKGFFQKFIMLSVSAFAMIFFFRFSLLLVMNGNPFWGLAAGMAALKTPDVLRDFMIGYGGGGVAGRAMSVVYASSMVSRGVSAIKGFKLPIR